MLTLARLFSRNATNDFEAKSSRITLKITKKDLAELARDLVHGEDFVIEVICVEPHRNAGAKIGIEAPKVVTIMRNELLT